MKNEGNIPEELKRLPQWVCATDDSKCPWMAEQLKAASSTNPATWSTFETARDSVDNGNYDYSGFVFADNGLVGIDIDAGFDEYGILTPLAVDIIRHCGGYVERSKSGRGFHIILKGDIPFKGKNNLAGVEIYKEARYFIITGDVLKGYEKIQSNDEGIAYVLEKYFPEVEKESKSSEITPRVYSPIWEYQKGNSTIPLRPTYPQILAGNRNLSLCSLAGQMHTDGYEKSLIYSELLRVNSTVVEPPLNAREIQQICNSITRYKRNNEKDI